MGDQLRGLKSKRVEEITTNLPPMFLTKTDCQLIQVLIFCSCSCPLCEQGAGWLFEFFFVSECDFDSTQDSGQSYSVIVHDM